MIKTRIEEGLDSLIEMYTIEIEDDTECLKKYKDELENVLKESECLSEVDNSRICSLHKRIDHREKEIHRMEYFINELKLIKKESTNEYQKVLQVLEKEYQVTCDVAGIEETDRAKLYFRLLENLTDKETPKKPIDVEIGPCGDLMLCCPNCEHGVVPIPTYHGNRYYPRCPFCGQKLMEEDKDDC